MAKKISRKKQAFYVWFNKLLMIAANIFKCENLPANLPLWQIESRLILTGHCCIFQNDVYGLITSTTALSGIDIYNMPNQFNYAQAVIGSKSGMVNLVDGVIGWGCSADKLVYRQKGTIGELIEYYADILSDIDISRRITLINRRATNSVTAKSDSALTALREFYRQLEQGELYVPQISSGVLDSTEDILKNISRSNDIALQDYDVATQNILKMFYADMGITYAMEKRERMLTDEVTAQEDALDGNLRDMLSCRQEMAAQVNATFGTKWVYGVNNDEIA